jgi:ATP-dependent Clp protease protease subunit
MSDPSEFWATFAGTIDNLGCDRIFKTFQHLVSIGAPRVHFLIQSSGGDPCDGIALYNYLRGVPLELITYNAGAVESAAVLPYLAGRVRKVCASAFFQLHSASTVVPERMRAFPMSVYAGALFEYNANIETIYRSEITLTDEQWCTYANSDLILGANAAVVARLAHELGDFTPASGNPYLCG